MTDLLLKRAATRWPSGDWNEDDYDVLADADFVGRIFKANASPVAPWMWTIAFWHQEGRMPTHGYEANARGCDGGVREELAAGVKESPGCAEAFKVGP